MCLERFSQDVCDDLYSSKNSDALDQVQTGSSHWVLGSTLSLSLTSIIIAQFLGSWSDTYGRKIPMLLPPIGKIIIRCEGTMLLFLLPSSLQSLATNGIFFFFFNVFLLSLSQYPFKVKKKKKEVLASSSSSSLYFEMNWSLL